jgi:tRNA threonylcarbamoyladenosine biosynthesis protein TsaE
MLPDRRLETFEHVSLEGLHLLAKELLRVDSDKKVWLFFGDMGAGKTTLIKAICAALNVEELVNSPTFSIINEYRSAAGKVFHFDF